MQTARDTLKITTFENGEFRVRNAIDDSGKIDTSAVSIRELLTSPYVFIRASGVYLERIAAAFTNMPMPEPAAGLGDRVYFHGDNIYSVAGFVWHGDDARTIALNLPNI